MGELTVERVGGFAGFGGPGSHLKSGGSLAFESLSAADQAAIEALFRTRGASAGPGVPDGFRYRITRATPSGPETVEAPEAAVPAAIKAVVKDELQ